MQPRLKEFLKQIAAPLILLMITVATIFIYDRLNLGSKDKMMDFAISSFEQYGYLAVLIGALIEGVLFVNWYLPGSIIIVLGVTLASQEDPLKTALIVGVIILSFLITAVLNYFLGKYGWYHVFMKLGLKAPLEKIRKRVKKRGLPIILTTYMHPNFGALTATSAGILRLPFWPFFAYSVIALVFWNTLWGIVVYFTGTFVLEILGWWLILAAITIWLVVTIIKFFFKKESSPVNVP